MSDIGWTALMTAGTSSNIDILKNLITNNADLDIQGKKFGIQL